MAGPSVRAGCPVRLFECPFSTTLRVLRLATRLTYSSGGCRYWTDCKHDGIKTSAPIPRIRFPGCLISKMTGWMWMTRQHRMQWCLAHRAQVKRARAAPQIYLSRQKTVSLGRNAHRMDVDARLHRRKGRKVSTKYTRRCGRPPGHPQHHQQICRCKCECELFLWCITQLTSGVALTTSPSVRSTRHRKDLDSPSTGTANIRQQEYAADGAGAQCQ